MKANPTHRSRSAITAGRTLSSLAFAGLLAFAVGASGCTGGSKGDPDNRGDFLVTSISTGSGSVYPYRIRTTDSFGNPTSTVRNIESEATLKQYVNGNNGVLPVATLPLTPVLPNGDPGNQFLHFTFSHKLDVDSILSPLLADQANAGLTGALTVLSYDPSTETTVAIEGRGFVNGFTYFNEAGNLVKVKAVEEDGSGVSIIDSRATGFPNYPGAADLVSKKSFVFIPLGVDGSLSTPDTFPVGSLIRLIVSNAVKDSEDDILEQEVGVATTVGPDTDPPEVLGYTSIPQISPGNGQQGVDPSSSILVRFNKPVQPGEVGSFFDPTQFTPATGGVSLQVSSASAIFGVIYYADPVSYSDLMNYIIRPAYSLPGNSTVDVTVQTTTINSLSGTPIGTVVTTNYETGDGAGLVNAPVAPEAVYVGVAGSDPGVKVIDLNGYGQGTGDPNDTRWPLNPNIGVPGVVPSMAPGTSTLDAGGKGVFTLTEDTAGSSRLLGGNIVSDVSDIHIGPPLDLIFNNENINRNASRSNQVNEILGLVQTGNTIGQPPIPNPPRLIFPPPNPNRAIFGEEPAVKSSLGPPGALVTGGPPATCLPVGLNLLNIGNPFSSVQNELGIYGTFFMGVFVGPQPPPASPPPPPPFCPFTSRQQVGHFLYVLDRDNRQILIVNSNRFTVLDTIRLSDPVSLATSPNMTRLAVSNFASSSVSFIDIDPLSASFHTVVAETRVESGPTGIAWQPDGEDIIVVSTEANQLTIISALDFTVRRTLGGFLNGPIDVVVTERYAANGNQSGVYLAYILNSNGTVAIYESGPDGVNGIGFNDIIGSVTNVSFPRAKSMLYDFNAGFGGVLIGHTDDNGLGQVSRLSLTSTPPGPLPLNPSSGGFILPPTYRQKEWTVVQRIGGSAAPGSFADQMTGNSIIDLAYDDLLNVGGLPGQTTTFATAFPTTPFYHSGKHTIKVQAGNVVPASNPRLLFVALSDVGNVDVFEISTGTRVATISVPGVRVVSNYWRQ